MQCGIYVIKLKSVIFTPIKLILTYLKVRAADIFQ